MRGGEIRGDKRRKKKSTVEERTRKPFRYLKFEKFGYDFSL
jgi:hypothetical protein